MHVPSTSIDGRRPLRRAEPTAGTNEPAAPTSGSGPPGADGPARVVSRAVPLAPDAEAVRQPLLAADLEGIVVREAVDRLDGTERLDTTLLLRDGRARLALSSPPLELVPPIDGTVPGGLWTRWREASDGGGYEVLDVVADVWTALGGRLFAPRPEATPADLAGSHERMRTTTLGATVSTVTERLELALDGTFARARSVFATTPAPWLDAGVPTVVHVPETADDPARLGGNWTLLEDGFTLELVDAGGRRERALFLDDGGSRLIGGRRFDRTAEPVETIDLSALATRWEAGKREASDWRSVFAEAMSRGVERRAVRRVDDGIAPAPPHGGGARPA